MVTIAMPVMLTVGAYFIFAAAVGAMWPPSDAQKAGWYGWFYRFLQRLAANADRVAKAEFGNLLGGAVANGSADAAVVATRSESSSITVASSGGK
jgi:hypothetical protein